MPSEANSLVSIIINNYNYVRFLPDAINSALAQTHPHVEVLVVDDGSTDDSREIIAAYGERIIPVLKENGGQASAFNAGFMHCRGEVVFFLDADDVLLPDIVARVVGIFASNVTVAKVQYRMENINAMGDQMGSVRPPWRIRMPNGDLRRQVLQFPDDIPYQPTSGNAFAGWVVRRIFPVPEGVYRLYADVYLNNLSSLFGIVISLDEIGAQYRMHGANRHTSDSLHLARTRQIIEVTKHTHMYLKWSADSLALTGFPDESNEVLSVTFIAHRMISLKMDRLRHPFKGDKSVQLLMSGIHAALRHFDFSLPKKMLYILWFTSMVLAPKPIARWLAERLFHPRAEEVTSDLIATLRRLLRIEAIYQRVLG